jgi:hypothetical protein
MYGVVVSYIYDNSFWQQVIDLEHDFNTIDGWNEMMSKIKVGDIHSNVVILYTHELRG